MEECRCGVYWVVYTRPGIHGSELEGEGAATGLTTECSITTPHSPSHTHRVADHRKYALGLSDVLGLVELASP